MSFMISTGWEIPFIPSFSFRAKGFVRHAMSLKNKKMTTKGSLRASLLFAKLFLRGDDSLLKSE